MKGVRLWLRVIHPYFKAVLNDIKLAYNLVLGNAFYPKGINLSIRRHESDVCCTVTYTFLVHNHLFAWFFSEYIEFIFSLSRKTIQGVLHVIFHKFRKAVAYHHNRSDKCVDECNLLVFCLIDIVIVVIYDCIHPI